LKPVSFERFLKAVNKFYEQAKSDLFVVHNSQTEKFDQQSFLYIKADKKIMKIFLDNILYIESVKDYVQIRTNTGTVITKSTISSFEEKLPENLFMRIHKSYIVSIAKIEAFTTRIIETNSKELPIGRSYKNTVLKTLKYPSKIL